MPPAHTSVSGHPAQPFQLFSTCPQSKDFSQADYAKRVIEVAQWSEAAGCDGILVYTDNGLVDNWSVAQLILEHTEQIAPLVAVQPLYMHPYMVAKRISTFAFLYGRKVYLNMLAGGFKTDLSGLGDNTPHDERYDRTTEYTLVIRGLLESDQPFTFEGKYYQVKNLKLTPPLPDHLQPGILISGTSDAGMAASRAIGAAAVRYPKPPSEEHVMNEPIAPGIRLGIIARDSAEAAWQEAYQRFPETRSGQVTHGLAMSVSDSDWHQQLSKLGEKPVGIDNPYWLGPFQNYQTFCPYLVGTYSEVAAVIKRYFELEFRTLITDIPQSEDDLLHIQTALQQLEGSAANL